ncbi:NAD(P)H-binding protein [Amycolatopsis acidiphila]|uniref:NAD-dependent epimerase/dehydratase family protein n=1 Tax=Amycolatopsis acidiphila TaxID=715473 RepID=A0A557ZYN6_9PSEU|nr:NAD(P)H-binding protein [Amycolatopsis acidiphila]TVT17126.1 NAD-dependent epimerase/dehydratase family protein [Amycolatopsis acidiphila]UIJ58316.1 NAD(P)H-binding protein [Amycolatopsis acidiphila]GHG95652.1 nucleotide-diphosphate-sugar epimerase [Amycolatopsis acidiphila]
MSETILVTGGTGTLGSVVAERLLGDGRAVRVLSRRPAPARTPYAWRTGDLKTGAGIAEATEGVDTIVHCASNSTGGGDVAATRKLIETTRGAHLVYISIVGIDKIPFFYYKAKLETERLIEGSGLPWTILRATQFHDLVLGFTKAQLRLPVTFTLKGRFQPVDVREVADRLVELALGQPAGRVPDMGGPEVRDSAELARAYLAAVGRSRPVVPVSLPGKAARAFRAGANLAPEHAVGKVTFERYLAERGS